MLRLSNCAASILLVIAIVSTACEDGMETVYCLADAQGPTIVITVTDARNGKPIAAGCQGIVTGRDGVDSLHACCLLDDGTPLGLMAMTSAGVFVVEVHKEGYRSWRKTNVRILREVCGLSSVALEASLEPLSVSGNDK